MVSEVGFLHGESGSDSLFLVRAGRGRGGMGDRWGGFSLIFDFFPF